MNKLLTTIILLFGAGKIGINTGRDEE